MRINLTDWVERHPARAGTLAGWYQQACGLLAAVVAVPLVIRLLPPGEAGLWFAFQSVLAILQLTDFGFTLALSRQVAFSMATQGAPREGGTDFLDTRAGWGGVSDVYDLTCRIFRWVCVIGLVVLAILYHAILPLGKMLEHRDAETTVSWYVLGISALLLLQAKPHLAVLDGMARVYLTRVLSGTQLLLSGFGVIAVLIGHGRLVHMALAVLATAVLYYAAARWCVRRTASRWLVPAVGMPKSSVRKFLRVTAPLGVLSLSAFMVTSVQVPLVGFILGTVTVPAYYLAQRIGSVLNQACLQFLYPQLPLFTRQIGARHYSEAARRMRRALVLATVLIVAANVVFYVAGPWVVDRWVGPGRYLTGLPLVVLAVDFCLMNCSGSWGAFVLARGINPFVISTLLSGAMTLVLCVVLGRGLGLLGITLASLVAGLCTNYWFVILQGLRLLRSLNNSTPQAA